MAKSKRPHKIRIDHHKDRSHTSTRHHKNDDGSMSSESSAHHDLDGVHDMLQQHMGAPNPGEAEALGGAHGVPAEAAGAAGIPMPSPAAGA